MPNGNSPPQRARAENAARGSKTEQRHVLHTLSSINLLFPIKNRFNTSVAKTSSHVTNITASDSYPPKKQRNLNHSSCACIIFNQLMQTSTAAAIPDTNTHAITKLCANLNTDGVARPSGSPDTDKDTGSKYDVCCSCDT